VGEAFEAFGVDVTFAVGDLLGTPYLEALPLLDGLDEVGRLL
jgi:hypothetical protein